MSKSKMTVLDLCLCALMIALHIVLEVFCTVRIGNDLKITFSTLPFILAGMMCGPVEGLVTGLVGTFLSQMITYGLMITTPIWVAPGALCGLAAGLIYMAFRRKPVIAPIVVSVAISELILVICNLGASYLDGVVIYKYWTVEAVYVLIPWRLLVWVILSVIYCLVCVPLCKILQKRLPADYRRNQKTY